MQSPMAHVTRCFVAGIVALLPIGGIGITILWLESVLSSGWLRDQRFYFPGLGLMLAMVAIYLTGVVATTFVGRYLWKFLDRGLERLPLFGTLYQSLKEILGYDSSKDHFFRGVVAVPSVTGHELGLITGECQGHDGKARTLVFVPGAPNPATGRLLLVPPRELLTLDLRASDVLRALVSLGKTPLARAPA